MSKGFGNRGSELLKRAYASRGDRPMEQAGQRGLVEEGFYMFQWVVLVIGLN
jgi:hypothetical protein